MADAVVATTGGPVRGEVGDGLSTFRGIPYARPPVGDLRFAPPRPPEPWADVRDATRFGDIAPQNPGTLDRIFGRKEIPQSEDCLTLTVWTPAADGGRRPVMVWIHGGAFISGSGRSPWYEGTAFARHHDVVVVTVNYRLGVLGFLHLDDVVDGEVDGSGNWGILDQVAALEWVRDNVDAFGGDPANVTVFGESAGAMSVGTLMGLPAAKGLFRRAIAQSGAAHHALDPARARRVASQVLAELGLEGADLATLRALPVDRVLTAQAAVAARNAAMGMAFQPVVDGATLPQRPIDAISEGSAAGVDLLIGTTAEEMRLYTAFDTGMRIRDRDHLLERCDAIFGAGEGEDPVTHYLAEHGDADLMDAYTAIETDRVFRVPAVRLAERQAGHGADVFMYLFTYRTPVLGGKLGSCHALEIPFVFDALDAPGAALFTGPVNEEMRELAAVMNAAWAAFARTGRPATPRLPEWPPYDHEHRATMVLGDTISVRHERGDHLRFWAKVL